MKATAAARFAVDGCGPGKRRIFKSTINPEVLLLLLPDRIHFSTHTTGPGDGLSECPRTDQQEEPPHSATNYHQMSGFLWAISTRPRRRSISVPGITDSGRATLPEPGSQISITGGGGL